MRSFQKLVVPVESYFKPSIRRLTKLLDSGLEVKLWNGFYYEFVSRFTILSRALMKDGYDYKDCYLTKDSVLIVSITYR
jgi:hypothetical protein